MNRSRRNSNRYPLKKNVITTPYSNLKPAQRLGPIELANKFSLPAELD